jgi:Ca2+-binding RTX toxin-like protein
MVKINRKNCLNYNELNLLIVNKAIIYLKDKKNLNISTFTTYFSLFCMLGSLFFIFIGIDFINEQQRQQQYQYNIINIAWADNLNGTENADNITGKQDHDKIKGFDGNDTIAGKEAGDNISGGSGDDIIYGNEGRDVLWGKAGNDRIEGGEGHDRIYGDRGNDMLIGDLGKDTLTGGEGKDIFICGKEIDTVIDFNVTQKDTTPENDCENIKYEGSGNIEANKNLFLQQQQENNNKLGNVNSKGEMTEDTTAKIDEQKQKSDSGGFFFGLFK